VQRWLSDPPPDHLFEIADYSLAGVSPHAPQEQKRERLLERGLTASPIVPNLSKPQLYREALARVSPGNGTKRPSAALVIPDYAVRMAILDFEEFPDGEQERASLVRFRLRKTVPFPIEEAQLAYAVQLEQPGHIELLAVAIAQPILQEYEAIFVDAGYRVGVVVPSVIAALPFCDAGSKGITLLAKFAGTTLSMVLLEQRRVRLVRCLDLSCDEHEEPIGKPSQERQMLLPMQQTLAFAEDQLGQPVSRALLCGFGKETDSLGEQIGREFGIAYAPVRSRYGPATAENAGLLGLLEQYAA
jgi:type IV pilus assembly protein PilM